MGEEFPQRGHRLYPGNMFGGKTAEMILRLQRAEIMGKKVQAFKVSWDNRYEEGYITANNGQLKFPAVSVANVSQLEEFLNSDTEVVGIDEDQFFDERLRDFFLEQREKRFLMSTILQNTYRGENFPLRGDPYNKEIDSKRVFAGDIMVTATDIKQFWPICRHENKDGSTCGGVAYFPQRWDKNGKLSKYSDQTIVLGAEDKYSPRCFDHFIRPTD